MAAPTFTNASTGQVPCSYHPDVQTGLRCTRCGKPICPRCAVRTPVGLRCPDCAGVRGLPTYRTPATSLARAAGGGLVAAVLVAVLWRFGPAWSFYLSLLLGFGVVETIARLSGNKRGRDLQLLAMGLVTVGLVLSRVLLAQRYGVTMEDLNNLEAAVRTEQVRQEFRFAQPVDYLLRIRLIPDLVYAALAYVIAWIRFR
jgi:hypothetical protein